MSVVKDDVAFAGLLHFPMTGGKVNRFEKERRRAGFLQSRITASRAPCVIVCRADLTPGFPSSVFVRTTDENKSLPAWLIPLEASSGKPIRHLHEAVFVGEDQVTHRNIFVTTAENVAADALVRGKYVNTRVLCEKLNRQDLALMGLAVSMLSWIQATRFCPRCGNSLVVRDFGMFQKCSGCKNLHFPQVNPAMIVCVLDGRGNVLLSQRKRKSFKSGSKAMLTVLSGFVAHGESQEDTVVREVREESGAEVTWLRYVGSQCWPYPFQEMIAYYALAERSPSLTVEEEELVNVAWVSKEEVRLALKGQNPRFFVPPKFTSAGVLLAAWAEEGRVNDRGEQISPHSKL